MKFKLMLIVAVVVTSVAMPSFACNENMFDVLMAFCNGQGEGGSQECAATFWNCVSAPQTALTCAQAGELPGCVCDFILECHDQCVAALEECNAAGNEALKTCENQAAEATECEPSCSYNHTHE